MKTIIGGKKLKNVILLILQILLLSACAVPKQRETAMYTPTLTGDANKIGWYKISFEIAWPENQEPSWYMDALLANRVIAPAFEPYRSSIRLWRFHRRANRDAAGHRFSFIFYTSALTSAQIIDAVNSQPALQKLLSENKLVQVDYDNPQINAKPNIEDTSDPSWPLMVQKTWPRFIMGASDMWLGLVREFAIEDQKEEKKDDDTLYREVQKQLSDFWRDQGQHPPTPSFKRPVRLRRDDRHQQKWPSHTILNLLPRLKQGRRTLA